MVLSESSVNIALDGDPEKKGAELVEVEQLWDVKS